jgi:hypothetical protein
MEQEDQHHKGGQYRSGRLSAPCRPAPLPRKQVLLCLASLLAVNLAIAAKLFGVEYSAYNGSVEGTFIAIARVMAQHPFEWNWWPLWTVGMPFENSYLPFLHWIVAGFSAATRLSPARSFHIVTAAFYVVGAPALFCMALEFTRKLAASFVAALIYSCVSVSTLLVPAIAADAGGALHLRRLQDMVVYGEAPHTVALALLPLATVCFARAITTRAVGWNLLAVVMAAAVVLSNAFGITALALALVCWLTAYRPNPLWKAAFRILAIAAVSFCWVSPWLSPSMLGAILNSRNQDGEFHLNAPFCIALSLVIAGYALLCRLLRRGRVSAGLQFFLLFGYVFAAIVGIWYGLQIAILPQPHRYQLEMDLALLPALVFGAAAIGERLPPRIARWALAASLTALAAQTAYTVAYTRGLIRAVDRSQLAEYRIAQWMDQHRRGERAFISGSAGFLYNVFTDNPQVRGGHAQFETNSFIRVVDFTVYTDTNLGSRAAEVSIFWLKAFGARAISVSGPESAEYFKPFAHPHKFDDVLPLLWRESGDSIYAVPSRSTSLAHVIPTAAVVTRRPSDGHDLAPTAAYVAALDDPQFPLATFDWQGAAAAKIRATIGPHQVVAVQESYDPGWQAWANGKRQRVRCDALGLMIIEPGCRGPCEITLRYTGGLARNAARILSFAITLLLAVLFIAETRRSEGHQG